MTGAKRYICFILALVVFVVAIGVACDDGAPFGSEATSTPTASAEATAVTTPAPPANTPTAMAASTPQQTSTPVPQPTITSAPQQTSTPVPQPTSTPAPQPTSTPAPQPTSTPAPQPTYTPAPQPTPTPAPQPTSTPTPQPTITATRYGFVWEQDGLTPTEEATLKFLEEIKAVDELLFENLRSAPWLLDEVSDSDYLGVINLSLIASADAITARKVVALPWIQTADPWSSIAGSLALNSLRDIVGKDPVLARLIVRLPAFGDGITMDEAGYLSEIEPGRERRTQPAWIKPLFEFASGGQQLYSNFSVRDRRGSAVDSAFAAIAKAIEAKEEHGWVVLELFIFQPWVQDGITHAEALLLRFAAQKVLHRQYALFAPDDSFLLSLMRGGGDSVASDSFATSEGEVNLFVIRLPSLKAHDQYVLQLLRTSIVELEDFIGYPHPRANSVSFPIVLFMRFDPEEEGRRAVVGGAEGYFHGDHIVTDGDPSDQFFERIIYHEMTHEYIAGKRWINEGQAEFMASYILDKTGRESLEDRYEHVQMLIERRCVELNGWSVIQDLLDSPRGAVSFTACHYLMGERFFLGMYNALGHETVSSAFEEIYRNRVEGTGPSDLEERVYRAFLSNTPPDKRDDFRNLYRVLHGGPEYE